MKAKKQREKNRRRASKLAQEAWQAAADDRLDLAIKIIQRAIDLNPGNPLLWHDRGSLLVLSGNDDDAANAFQAAIQLAPEFADAFAALAAIHARQGKLEQAVPLQREAVRFARHPEQHQKRLAAYEAMLAADFGGDIRRQPPRQTVDNDEAEHQLEQSWPDLAAAIERLDWLEIGGRLTEHGFAHVRTFLARRAAKRFA